MNPHGKKKPHWKNKALVQNLEKPKSASKCHDNNYLFYTVMTFKIEFKH